MNDEIKKTVIPENLVTDLKQIILQSRQSAYAAVNACMISAYWKIGQRIVEEEQRGECKSRIWEGTVAGIGKNSYWGIR